MQITLKFVNPAKEGKKYGTVVGMDDARFAVKADMVGRFVKGQTYEVETENAVWGDSPVTIIKTIKGSTVPAPAASSGGGATGDKWWMPFVSNTVAHAIQVGKIESPGEIKVWAAAAKQAAEEIASGKKPASFDDLDSGPDF